LRVERLQRRDDGSTLIFSTRAQQLQHQEIAEAVDGDAG
jgi:hypothetical protein